MEAPTSQPLQGATSQSSEDWTALARTWALLCGPEKTTRTEGSYMLLLRPDNSSDSCNNQKNNKHNNRIDKGDFGTWNPNVWPIWAWLRMTKLGRTSPNWEDWGMAAWIRRSQASGGPGMSLMELGLGWLYMCVYIYTYIYTHIICACAQVYMFISTYIRIHTNVYVHKGRSRLAMLQ